jgi:hypothetical protein
MTAVNLSKLRLRFGDAELLPGPVVGDVMHGKFVQTIFIEQDSGNERGLDNSTLQIPQSPSSENGAN